MSERESIRAWRPPDAPAHEQTGAHAFALDSIAATREPVVQLQLDGAGAAMGAIAAGRIDAPCARVWSVIEDLENYAQQVPLVRKVTLAGDRVTVTLRFKIALFSATFQFVADRSVDPERSLDLRYVSGQPEQIHLRFDLIPVADGAATVLYVTCGFDIRSLGWLVKFFLKHHPEIQLGVYSGTGLALLDSIRSAAERG